VEAHPEDVFHPEQEEQAEEEQEEASANMHWPI
jgi:hypothetical protein